jgi:hypothetical protein
MNDRRAIEHQARIAELLEFRRNFHATRRPSDRGSSDLGYSAKQVHRPTITMAITLPIVLLV